MSRPGIPLRWQGTVRRQLEPAATDMDDFFRRLEAGAGLHDLGDEAVYLCEELVRTQGFLGWRQQRALALAVLCSFASARQGSTRLPLGGGARGPLGRLVAPILAAAGDRSSPAAVVRDIQHLVDRATFDSLIGPPGSARPLIAAGGALYQQRLHACERRLAEMLGRRLDLPPLADAAAIEAAMADVRARPPRVGERELALTGEQLEAAAAALAQPFTVISGGPGTGKTAVVTAILRAAVRLGLGDGGIALAAPTGKAAQRIADAVSAALSGIGDPSPEDETLRAAVPAPETLHRLLGYVPAAGSFRHHENNPVRAELIVVDEASMIDLVLMERLFRAAPPTARLVLLGDADQLPSVDAGAVFRDLAGLAGPDAGFSRRLTISHRMDPADPNGRAILTCAGAVQRGEAAAALPLAARRRRLSELRHEGVELWDTGGDPARTTAFVDHWFSRQFRGAEFARLAGKEYRREGGAFSAADAADLERLRRLHERCRLLTVTRQRGGGSEAIGRHVHDLFLQDATALSRRPDFYPGEPVMMRANDYRRGLYNGDQGMVVRVRDDGGDQHFRLVFPKGGEWLVFSLDALRSQVEHSAAMTVHKSQGSEFDHVALVFPDADLPLATRELVYTAITRARRSVTLVGAPKLLEKAIKRAADRFSGLPELLAETKRGDAGAPPQSIE